MIVDGKKAGDIAQEGNKRYKVLDVMVGGYILEDITNKPRPNYRAGPKRRSRKKSLQKRRKPKKRWKPKKRKVKRGTRLLPSGRGILKERR